MENNKSLEVFSAMPVPKAVLKNAIPAMIAMLMVLIYNLADTFFIGQIHDALQVAAVSVATPIFLIFMSVGTIFGIGGTSVISRALGEGRNNYAKKVSSFCMWSSIILGIAMSLFIWIFMDQIVTIAGASAETINLVKVYIGIVLISGPFILVSTSFSNILRAEGQSSKAMMGVLIGNLINIVLDPIMILGFGWNIAGAAIATVIGNVIAASYYILYFCRENSMLSINIKHYTLKDKVFSGVMAIGIPASLGSVLMSMSQIIMNGLMSGYGDMALAAIGVAMRVVMITGMLAIGLGQGIQPLLGYSVGARTWGRFRKILLFSLSFAFVLSFVLTGACYLFTNQIVSAFLTEPSAFRYAVQFARILLVTSALFGVFYVVINALQAMGAAVSSLVINLSRQGLIYIPALFLLKLLWGMNGLIWAQPVADILSLVLAIILYQLTIRKMTAPSADSNTCLPNAESIANIFN